MNINQRDEGGVTVFVLQGRVDTGGAAEMDQVLHQAAAQGKHKMVLDMSGVEYMNSAGLRILADMLTENQEHEGDLLLVALSPRVERVFKIIGFDRFFEIYENVESAVSDF